MRLTRTVLDSSWDQQCNVLGELCDVLGEIPRSQGESPGLSKAQLGEVRHDRLDVHVLRLVQVFHGLDLEDEVLP